MTHEIRLRLPVALYNSIAVGAARRSIAVSSLVSLAVYEYLRERGEIAHTQAPAKSEPVADIKAWLASDDDDEPLNVGS